VFQYRLITDPSSVPLSRHLLVRPPVVHCIKQMSDKTVSVNGFC